MSVYVWFLLTDVIVLLIGRAEITPSGHTSTSSPPCAHSQPAHVKWPVCLSIRDLTSRRTGGGVSLCP